MSQSRNFGFRVPPLSGARGSRYAVSETGTPIPIGAPVVLDPAYNGGTGKNLFDQQVVKLAPADTSRGNGSGIGILYYEYVQDAYRGLDPVLASYSDLDVAPLGQAVQLIRGQQTVKVWMQNTVARLALNTRNYPGRVMVAGMGATPTVVVGQFLIPGTGDDVNGYWKPTSSAANGWLEVTSVDLTRGLVEARALF